MEFDKDVPAPESRHDVFLKMEIGDSVFFPNEPKGSQASIVSFARYCEGRHNIKFSAKSENGGVRITRVVKRVMPGQKIYEIPKAQTHSGDGHVPRTRKYPFSEMQAGDSIFFPNESLGSLSKPAKAAIAWGGRYGRKFKSRSVDGGVRIWRVA